MTVDPAISDLPSAHDEVPAQGLSVHDWDALPLETRITCLLFDALAALDILWRDLQTEEGNSLRWLEPHLLAVSDNIEKIMERLAS